jgi:hypothetical protein
MEPARGAYGRPAEAAVRSSAGDRTSQFDWICKRSRNVRFRWATRWEGS